MKNESTVFRSLELIENRISEKLTVENIANSVYFSKYHYQRLFHEAVGNSVMEYVTKRKLTLAGRALLETNANIIDIALEYGYECVKLGTTELYKIIKSSWQATDSARLNPACWWLNAPNSPIKPPFGVCC